MNTLNQATELNNIYDLTVEQVSTAAVLETLRANWRFDQGRLECDWSNEPLGQV